MGAMTYKQIDALLANQDQLVAEGKMEKPAIKYGFTPCQRREFDNGISIEEYVNKHEVLIG